MESSIENKYKNPWNKRQQKAGEARIYNLAHDTLETQFTNAHEGAHHRGAHGVWSVAPRQDQPSGDSTGPKATPACTAGLLNFRVKARMDIRAYQIDKTVRRFWPNI